MRVRHVEPKLVALSAAIQPTRSSVASSSTGAGSTARRIGFSFSPSSALTSTTTPTRDAPRRGASTRWPLVTVRPSGTRYENGWAIGASNATSATMSPRSAAVVLPAGEFEIFPGHALVLLAGVPQQERGMERGDQHAVAVRMQPPAELADRLARLEQRLAGHAPERQHDLRVQHAELGVEERRAGSQLVGLRIAIARWAAFDRVGDVHLVARELDRFEHLREQLAGAAHEGLALCVLVGARALADDDELGARAARAEHDRVALLAQRAAAAALEATLLGGQRLGRAEEVVAGQAELAHAEIAVVTERVAERAQGIGQERARIVGQRLIRSPRAVARTVSRWLKIASATAALLIRGSPRSPPQRSSRSTSLSSASKPMPD